MDIYTMQCYPAVIHEGTIPAAAESLRVEQPSLSPRCHGDGSVDTIMLPGEPSPLTTVSQCRWNRPRCTGNSRQVTY